MRVPRRTPWSNLLELSELHDFLFSPSSTHESRLYALSRMAIYTSSPSCPAFMYILQDLITASILPTQTAAQASSARLACAMAIVRFVNGMVDPLQTGPYARPIAHLAATLGIPQSLISLRHRATHEDLPPLVTLLNSAYRCIDYIHRYSFLPLLSAPTASTSNGITGSLGSDNLVRGGMIGETRVEALIGRWKKVVKARVKARDVTVESESGREVRRLKKEVEEFDVDEVVDAIVRVGLVPIARKKRPSSKTKRPSDESIQIWCPLLTHLTILSPSLPVTFAASLLSAIITTSSSSSFSTNHIADAVTGQVDIELESWRWTLATWFIWIWSCGSLNPTGLGMEEDEIEKSFILSKGDKMMLWRKVSRELIRADVIIQQLYRALISIDPVGPTDLDQIFIDHYIASQPDMDDMDGAEHSGEGKMETKEDVLLDRMESHLRALERKVSSLETGNQVAGKAGSSFSGSGRRGAQNEGDVEGWKRIEMVRPCPIGMWIS